MSRPDNKLPAPTHNWLRTPSPPPDLTHLLAKGTSGTQSLTILGIFPELLRSYDILPQKQFVQSRNSAYGSHHLFLALREDIFTKIEMELFSMIDDMIGLSPGVVQETAKRAYSRYHEDP